MRGFCPISFVNEKQTLNPDLNELFIAGYRDKVCTDYSTSLIVDDIKKTIDLANPTDSQEGWLNDMKQAEYKAHIDAVMSYLVCQTTDLTYNTIILIAQLICENNQEPLNALIDYLVNKENLRGTIIEILSPFQYSINRDDPGIAMVQLNNIMMSSVYSKIIATVFDPLVERTIAFFAGANHLDVLYGYLYNMTYNGVDEISDASYSDKYNFCATILREAIDMYTLDYRKALYIIATNISIMSTYCPQYGKEIYNPNYITSEEEYLDTGLFGEKLLEEDNE